jgi:energy-coupling factor transport system ATP-binding protein
MTFMPGGVTVITGPSGCGKSTLLYIAAGIYPQNAGVLLSGCVCLGAVPVASEIPERRARMIGMIFQNPDLQFCMDTVWNELIFCLENIAVPREEMDELITEALAFCGIEHLRERRLTELSGGEKQKAMLACIVCLGPEWLLLDEPFANIDGAAAAEIAGKLRRLADERGVGIVTVDHKLDVWLDIADEIKVMTPGGGVAAFGLVAGSEPCAGIDELPSYGVDIPSRPYRLSDDAGSAAEVWRSDRTGERAEEVLTLANVSVMAKKKMILSGIDARFAQGRIHAILGTSGCGKSTLLEAICGFRKYEGSILVLGDEAKKLPRAKLGLRMGFVFQNPQDQFVASTVYEEVMAGAGDAAEAERILREIGLWRFRQFSPYMLSQGEQRRLAVAALLAYKCRILICDEPTYAQDLNSLTSVMDGLKRRVDEDGLTLIFSTHDKKLAHDYADQVYLLSEEGFHEISKSDM